MKKKQPPVLTIRQQNTLSVQQEWEELKPWLRSLVCIEVIGSSTYFMFPSFRLQLTGGIKQLTMSDLPEPSWKIERHESIHRTVDYLMLGIGDKKLRLHISKDTLMIITKREGR